MDIEQSSAQYRPQTSEIGAPPPAPHKAPCTVGNQNSATVLPSQDISSQPGWAVWAGGAL